MCRGSVCVNRCTLPELQRTRHFPLLKSISLQTHLDAFTPKRTRLIFLTEHIVWFCSESTFNQTLDLATAVPKECPNHTLSARHTHTHTGHDKRGKFKWSSQPAAEQIGLRGKNRLKTFNTPVHPHY